MAAINRDRGVDQLRTDRFPGNLLLEKIRKLLIRHCYDGEIQISYDVGLNCIEGLLDRTSSESDVCLYEKGERVSSLEEFLSLPFFLSLENYPNSNQIRHFYFEKAIMNFSVTSWLYFRFNFDYFIDIIHLSLIYDIAIFTLINRWRCLYRHFRDSSRQAQLNNRCSYRYRCSNQYT